MSRRGSEAEKAGHETIAEELREEAPRMDDLRRARLERRVIARARGGASTSQEIAPIAASAGASRGSAGWRSSRVVLGGLALAAAALIGFVVRGALGPAAIEGPRFAIGSAFETREGILSDGARIELASGEEGRLEIGDVSAALRDGGAMEVRSTDIDDVRLVLDRGTAELAFHPHERGRQHLFIATPSAEVEVVGTVFTVAVDVHGTTVSVREGTVRVTGRTDGSSVLVHAGDAVTVPPIRTASVTPATRPSADHAVDEGVATVPVGAELVASTPITPAIAPPAAAVLPAPLAFRPTPAARTLAPSAGTPTPSVGTPSAGTPSAGTPSAGTAIAETTGTIAPSSEQGSSEAATTSATQADVAHTLADPRAGEAAQVEAPRALSELTAVHPRVLAVDSWSAHRPSSREIAAAWHDIDELQARGQFERSLELLVRLEHYAPASDQDEALFDRARTVQEALRRPRAARALYAEYVRRFPEGRHIQEVRRRLDALGGREETQPPVVIDGTILEGGAP